MVASYPLGSAIAGRRVVLASGSPRRRELLGLFGVAFDVVPADVDETPCDDESPVDLVVRLAAAKAFAIAGGQQHDVVVIGADTIVDVDGEILGKPNDPADAARMLGLLSGRTHQVHTAVTVVADGGATSGLSTTDVTFSCLSPAEIAWYVGTGEPLDKAGAYGLQGQAGIFVASVVGSVSGVLGLPLDVLVRLVRPAMNRSN